MKIFLIITMLCVFSSAFSHDIEKAFFENNPKLGGDVTIKSTSIKVVGKEIFKTFEIESLDDGLYYMDAWILVPSLNKVYPEYKIEINGLLSDYSFKPKSDNWQSLALTDAKNSAATVKIRKGINSISIIGERPLVPEVEFIKLSLNSLDAGISDKAYKEYVEKIKSSISTNVENSDSMTVNTRSNQLNFQRGTAGEIYDYIINMPVYYTTQLNFSWSAGEVISINTSQIYSFGHVIELFPTYDHTFPPWTALFYGNGYLNASLPITGLYTVRVRSYQQFTQSMLNISVESWSYPHVPYTFNNCIVTSSGIELSDAPGIDTKNYFTSKIKSYGSTNLFLIGNGTPGNILHRNDGGGIKSDGYNWGKASLITTSNNQIFAGLVSSSSSYNPSFECDLYLGVQPLTNFLYIDSLSQWFPNLPIDNAFISGPFSSLYNCFMWSVGSTRTPNPFGACFILSHYDKIFDDFGYTRSCADENNAAIALWANDYVFTHASVRKNSTIPNPHGFEWESKCGSCERIMHTKDALNSFGNSTAHYGSIAYYYRPKNGTINYSLPLCNVDTIDDISTRSNNVQQSFLTQDLRNQYSFTQPELTQLTALIELVPAKIKSDFEEKYKQWEEAWSRPKFLIYSVLWGYTQCVEYDNLVEYCKTYSKIIWPLVVDKYTKEHKVIYLLKDVTYQGSDFFNEIKEKFVGVNEPEPELMALAEAVAYCKDMLTAKKSNFINSLSEISKLANEEFEKVFISHSSQKIIINLHSEKNEELSIKIFNISGNIEYESRTIVSKGNHTKSIDASNFKKGMLVVQVTIGSDVFSRKINI